MNPASPLRMAVIGCGRVGLVHARAIQATPHASLVAVCDVAPDTATRVANEMVASRFLEHRSLLREMQLDAVTIATPGHRHLEPALAAMEAGLHVFCEKPLADRLDDARRLLDAARQNQVCLAVDYNRRYAFGYTKARQLVAEGRIGQLRHALIQVTDQLPPPRVPRSPAMMLTHLLSHHVDLLRWFCGEFATVAAHWVGDIAEGLVRDATLCFTSVDGPTATLVGSYQDHQTRTTERMLLVGGSGQLQVEDVTKSVSLFTDDPDQLQLFQPNGFVQRTGFYDTIDAHLHDFIGRVARKEPLAVTGEDGLRGLEIAEAAIQSQRQQQPIALDESER